VQIDSGFGFKYEQLLLKSSFDIPSPSFMKVQPYSFVLENSINFSSELQD